MHAVIKARLTAAFAAVNPAATKAAGLSVDPAFINAMVVWTLQQRLKGTKDVTFTESADGFLALVFERSLTEEVF